MARGYNRVTLIGNLGNDPEIKYTGAGTAIAKISLATSESWTKDGEKHEKTEWHRVVFFGKLAEIVGEYLKKGRQVFVVGKISYGSYEDKEGVTRYTTDIIADEMQILGSAPDRGNNSSSDRSSGRSGGGSKASGGREQAQRREPEPEQRQSDPFPDDDIPF